MFRHKIIGNAFAKLNFEVELESEDESETRCEKRGHNSYIRMQDLLGWS
jgi:hypothetical protein